LSTPFQSRLSLHAVEVLICPAQMSELCSGGPCRRLGDCDVRAGRRRAPGGQAVCSAFEEQISDRLPDGS